MFFIKKQLNFKIGLMLGLFHFIFSIFVAIDIIRLSSGAQWQFLWFFPFLIDFPISLLYIFLLALPFPRSTLYFLPYPISHLRDFLLPFFFHSVLGTLWYFFLPIILANLINKLRKKRTKNRENSVCAKEAESRVSPKD
jgi:hypothetical protein